MKAEEVRRSFLDFFESKDHKIVPSSPVVPQGDPTLLFTNAGMNQFKDVFLGIGTRDYKRAANTQKCIRVSGKHNDLEEVGVDTYHHTFFEMLGNWSFGDYYKEEAIEWAWELLTKVWGLPFDRLFATVFRTDDEAYNIWKKFLPESRIFRFDEKDNFWEMGEVGPCGPCSEIHFDRTKDKSGANLVNAGNPDVIEIWNLVFIQYNRNSDGILEPLKSKHIDTGMGLERITAVLNGKDSNYDTDLFQPLIQKIEEYSNRKYPSEVSHHDGIAMRVIADHIRTISFAIADGVYPSNEGRGYVIRRILRRASRYARRLGFKEPVIYRLVPTLIEIMGVFFGELIQNRQTIERIIRSEEENFIQTLDRGIERFEHIVEEQRKKNSTVIPGELAFQLYDTFGFPLDLTQLMAREIGFSVDENAFNKKMEEQRERSRQATKFKDFEIVTLDSNIKTKFTGYEEFETVSKVVFLDKNVVVTEETPFYVESGGQVSDKGWIIFDGKQYKVVELAKSGEAIIHFCNETLPNILGKEVTLKVDSRLRLNTMKNHSATHLLHESLCRILGPHVKQAGSLVEPRYLRFDFNHFEKMTEEEIEQVETLVNEKIFEALPVKIEYMTLEEAKNNTRAKMFFGEKYGDFVRVVSMGDFSQELCGGTHVRNTNEIGIFKILSEQSIAAGVRRIEAITGPAVYSYLMNLKQKLVEENRKAFEYEKRIKELERELEKFEIEKIKIELAKSLEKPVTYNSIRFIFKEIPNKDIDFLRDIGEQLRYMLVTNGIGILYTIVAEKIYFVCVVTDDLKEKYPAGKIVNKVASLFGGKGGGRPHLATAGTKYNHELSSKLNEINNMLDFILN